MKGLRYHNLLVAFLFLVGLIFQSNICQAQKTKSQLEKEKQENLKKIKEASKVLEQTKVEEKATLGQLNAINEKVRAQKRLISTINEEIEFMQRDIDDNQLLITSLEEDLDKAKKEYANMVYQSSKTNNGYNKLLFVFSSGTIYDIYLRYKFLEEYADARKVQAEQIIGVSTELRAQNDALVAKKDTKEDLLSSMLMESQNLSALRKEKDVILTDLKGREKELMKEVKKREQEVANLDKLIADLVKAEIAKKTKKGDTKMTLTPEAMVLSNSFNENKGRLIWPVEYGFVTHRFGKHPHPDIPGVVVDNLGIDVQTKSGSQVRAVFDGTVTAVAVVPGMQNVVMIQHGEFFTVYAKVDNVQVKMGNKISRKDIIGTVHTKADGVSEVQFQVWKTSQKQNPEYWISKK